MPPSPVALVSSSRTDRLYAPAMSSVYRQSKRRVTALCATAHRRTCAPSACSKCWPTRARAVVVRRRVLARRARADEPAARAEVRVEHDLGDAGEAVGRSAAGRRRRARCRARPSADLEAALDAGGAREQADAERLARRRARVTAETTRSARAELASSPPKEGAPPTARELLDVL